MRLKTEAMRAAIVSAAWDVFKENGFERTTMSQISARLGGSKATLYGYFRSKEDLFAEAVEQVMRKRAEEAFQKLSAEDPLDRRLLEFGRTYLQMRLDPDMVALYRALTSEADRADFGEALRQQLIVSRWRAVAAELEQEMKAGHLRKADPYLAAMHFRGLIESDIVERRLHGDHGIAPAEIEEALESGTAAFLRAYAP